MNQTRRQMIVMVFVFAFSTGTLVFAFSAYTQQNRRFNELAMQNCLAIEKLKSYTRGALDRNFKTLPTLAYYKQHPGELRVQMLELGRLRQRFKQQRCP